MSIFLLTENAKNDLNDTFQKIFVSGHDCSGNEVVMSETEVKIIEKNYDNRNIKLN